jgi:uncharacterized protein
VLIQPGARQNEVIGLHDGAIKIRIKSAPVDGEANAALIKFISQHLKIPQKEIQILNGLTNKRKTLQISTDLSTEQILEKLKKN